MSDWFFLQGDMEKQRDFSNPGLEMFKGEPIRAKWLGEICQNSLEVRDKNKPVRVEFEKVYKSSNKFLFLE